MDGCGAGEAPDAAEFGDLEHPATVQHVYEVTCGFKTPVLEALGFFEACRVPVPSGPQGLAGFGSRYGRLQEMSKGGKDSVTGHWEMVGITTSTPFPTYPNGFPADLVDQFQHEIGLEVIGNCTASGTEIIARLGEEHVQTGKPILYTSADSVFQVACHESVIPIERLYEICRIARRICTGEHSVQRVIARPFEGSKETGFKRTDRRKDFPLEPAPNLCDEIGDVLGIGVVPELFDGRGFRVTPRTQSNIEHEGALFKALDSDARFIWANFEDFDMRYGHRSDPVGFARCLEAFDDTLGRVLSELKEEDLLILTADHGNDPTDSSTDHSREFVPVLVVGRNVETKALGDVQGMNAVGATVAAHLNISWQNGTNLLAR